MSRIVVVFPAPFGPRNPVTMPGRTVNVRSSTAVLSPYRLVSPRASILIHLTLASAIAADRPTTDPTWLPP